MDRTRCWALVLALASCTHLKNSEGVRARPSAALITAAQLDRAATEVANDELVIRAVDEGRASADAGLGSSLPDAELSGQTVLPGVGGYLAYLRVLGGSSSRWQIWLTNQSTDNSTGCSSTEGSKVTSVAVDLVGEALFFYRSGGAGEQQPGGVPFDLR